MSVWFAAPNLDRANELSKEFSKDLEGSKISSSVLSKKDLFERLGITEQWETLKKDAPNLKGKDSDLKYEYNFNEFVDIPNDLPNLIFIDEITHFNALELSLLNSLVDSLQKSGRFVKIIVAGDMSQKGAIVKGRSYNVERVSGVFVPKLKITIRPSNAQKRVNNDTLEGIVEHSIHNYEDDSDLEKILKFLQNKLKFRYYKSENTIDGDLIVDNISLELLRPIKNALENPNKTLGVLLTPELLPIFDSIVESLGINKNQIKYFTPDTIQGSEADFFIFNMGNITESVITHKLKAFYTYMSRAKSGSIIIGDKNIEHLDISNLPADDAPEYVQPLTDVVINEAKEARHKILTDILNPNFSVKQEFKFSNETNVIDEPTVETKINEEFIP
jgi:hypothetical protein